MPYLADAVRAVLNTTTCCLAQVSAQVEEGVLVCAVDRAIKAYHQSQVMRQDAVDSISLSTEAAHLQLMHTMQHAIARLQTALQEDISSAVSV